MTLKTGVERLKVEIEALEAAIGKADPAPVIIDIRNDPERRHAGPDEATIDGQVFLRGENEDRGQFDARLRAAAVAAGERVICVSLADYEGPFLDDFRIDVAPGKTIEIGSAMQS
jgi:hypothetical protein